MRKSFPGYFRPTDGAFKILWQDCIFAFDANVLLNLYRYSSQTRESFLKILGTLKPRIWLSHQAGLEFQRNRTQVVSDQRKQYEEIRTKMSSLIEGLKKSYARHPYIEIEKLTSILEGAEKKVSTELSKWEELHPDLLTSDDLKEKIADLFDGCVGPAYSEKKLEEIRKSGEERYKRKIPPGFADHNKDESKKYGDLVLWSQLMDHGTAKQKPIILVTDDRKEDWWLKHEGKTIGPHPELVAEITEQTSQAFYMYQTDQFIEQAEKYLAIGSQKAAVKEAREVKERDEVVEHAIEAGNFMLQTRGVLDATNYLQRQIDSASVSSNLNSALNAIKSVPIDTSYMLNAALLSSPSGLLGNLDSYSAGFDSVLSQMSLGRHAFANLSDPLFTNLIAPNYLKNYENILRNPTIADTFAEGLKLKDADATNVGGVEDLKAGVSDKDKDEK